MLNKILIENFKCFKKQLIPLAPLTLFTGFNAAGKSSAIQTLLIGRQLQTNPDGGVAAPLNGDCIKLGTVGDVRCHFSTEKEITISYSSELSDLSLKMDASVRDSNSLPFKASEDENSQEIYNTLQNIIYLSATRNGTLDVYPTPDESFPIFANVGECGQFAPWWFAQFSDEEINEKKLIQKEPANTLRRQFNAWASELFPNVEANAEGIERTPLVKLELRTSKQQQWKRPANIGYGLTYAFPIIVAGLLAKEGQILVVDSPEAHLHPLGQSRIGYFLGAMAAAGVQVIIETHSDHVLNGIRLAVAQKVINNKEVAIHFFKPNSSEVETSPSITSPQIDSTGALDIWPTGFFDQTDKDLALLNGWA
jgi:predicted ATPase